VRSSVAGASPPARPGAGGQKSAGLGLLAHWRQRLLGSGRRVLLADGEDLRAIEAAGRLHAQGVLTAPLLGSPEHVLRRASPAWPVPDELVVDPRDLAADARVMRVLRAAFENQPDDRLRAARKDPLHLASAALRAGIVDACVAGAARPTADVLRAGIRVIGPAHGVRNVSSVFLMMLADGRVVAFADCAVLPDPDPGQLADIAVAAAHSYRSLTSRRPVIAMLSFSTQGSATHYSVNKVRAATELVRARLPGVPVDGELQLDAALVDSVARVKAPGSTVAGHANVLVFPNLDAGNIGYKIAERLGGATALGPILQGLAAPLNDLSRGCSSHDIEVMAMISGVQALDTPGDRGLDTPACDGEVRFESRTPAVLGPVDESEFRGPMAGD
jgi:phosphotransacetylase